MSAVRRRPGPRSRFDEEPIPIRPGEWTVEQLAVKRVLATRWNGNRVHMAADLTRETGVKFTDSAIGTWVRGERNPRRKYLEAIARYLGTDLSALLIPAGICKDGVWRYPGDPTYERLAQAMDAVDPTLKKTLQ